MSLVGKIVRQTLAASDGTPALFKGKVVSVKSKKGKYPKYHVTCSFSSGDCDVYTLGSVVIDYLDGDLKFVNPTLCL